MSSNTFFTQPIGIQWRKALVSLPRVVPNQFLRITSPDGPQPSVINLPSRAKHSISIYIFVPVDIQDDRLAALPVVVDFHGGGFVMGSCLEQAPFCSKLARELGCIVMSVDYRMGPVAQHPAALEDAEDVLSAILDQSFSGYQTLREIVRTKIQANQNLSSQTQVDLDKTRIAVSGFSSGGNIALNLGLSIHPPQVDKAWLSRFGETYNTPIPLLLYYPSFDCRQLPSERTRPPGMPMTNGFWGDVEGTLMPTYLPRDQASHPRASPGLADVCKGLHPQARVLLVLPELDSLSEQSETWVKKVAEAGREDDLVVERFKGMKHGWTQMPGSWLNEEERRTTAEIFEKTVTFVRSAWAQKT